MTARATWGCVAVRIGACLGLCLAHASGGCASSGPRATRLQAADLQLASDDAARSLATSDLLSGRGENAPQLVIRPEAAVNLSSDRLSRVDRWGMVTRVLYTPEIIALMRDRNIKVVAEREVARGYLERFNMTNGGEVMSGLVPTHLLQAQVRTLTRAGAQRGSAPADVRADTYLVEYTLLKVGTGEVVWTASSEIKRAGWGRLVD